MTWRIGDPLVYVIEAIGLNVVKIGTTRDLSSRLAVLQTSCPAELRVLFTLEGGADMEAALHRRFVRYCVRGEWFLHVPEIDALRELLDPATPEGLL